MSMTSICFSIAKVQCQKLNIIRYFFFLSYMLMHDIFKKTICKEYKSKKNQNAFKMIVSVFVGDVGVIWCTSKVIVSIKQLWLCVSVFDFFISQIIIIWETCAHLLCFHTQHTYSLLLLIHVQIQCDLAIIWNTCINICSLNYLNLFLKYKFG